MKTLHFQINYRTNSDEQLQICYSLDGNNIEKSILHTDNGYCWKTDIKTHDNTQHIRYAYQVINEHGTAKRIECNCWRFFHFNHRSEILFCDSWADHTIDPIYLRAAFSKCLMKPRGGEQLHLQELTTPCLLILHALPPTNGMKWAVVGNTRDWGKWNIQHARMLQRSNTYEWTLPLTRADFEEGVEYKYILVDPLNPQRTIWENGNNRCIHADNLPVTASAIRQDEMPDIDMPRWKGAGCVIPVFSLRSKGSFGIGDFGDLRLFIQWAARTALKAVQLLPINDTTHSGTWRDSYPYNGISVFALHPMYLDPREWKNSTAYKTYAPKAQVLNDLPVVDYDATYKLKTAFTKALYKEIGANITKSRYFKQFAGENNYWLEPYAQFCAYRDHFKTSNFRIWPKKAGTKEIAAPNLNSQIVYHKFVQYLLHRQMSETHVEAQNLGVLLKGDIPIGICPDSVPAWVDGHLFHFNGQAGAPPDDFAKQGQNWGFPTYNWTEMAKNDYAWWRNRLNHLKKYFDAYRIDHVLGFFRIWEIPSEHVYGILGHFRPALPFSIAEIHGFGFNENVEKYSVPFFDENYIDSMAEKAEKGFKTSYFEPLTDGLTLKPKYRSQRYIEQQVKDEATRTLLMNLATEVLFIADPEQKGLYHPRISAQHTHVFDTLSEKDKQAFNNLHDVFFYQRHNQFWADEAMKKIPAITQSQDRNHPQMKLFPLDDDGMLPCAEDLGMVPQSVKGVLERLQILSLEIQRMPKTYGLAFDNLEHNPYLSVATIATHDMPPFRLWWKEEPKKRQMFWHEVLQHDGEASEEANPEICEDIVARHIHCPSMLCMLALQDYLGISPELRNPHPETEQINVPANPNQYWQYRMHLTIEDLIQATSFNEKLISLIQRESPIQPAQI